MKKRYKGYFKKQTNILTQTRGQFFKQKREYSKDGKFRIRLWVNLFSRDRIKKLGGKVK